MPSNLCELGDLHLDGRQVGCSGFGILLSRSEGGNIAHGACALPNSTWFDDHPYSSIDPYGKIHTEETYEACYWGYGASWASMHYSPVRNAQECWSMCTEFAKSVGSNLSGIDYWPEGRPVVGPSDVRGRALGQRGPKGWCFCEDACTSFDVTSPSSPPHIVVVDPALLPADSRLRANCTTLD